MTFTSYDPSALLHKINPEFVRYEDNVLITSIGLFSDSQKPLLLDAFRELRSATIEECAKLVDSYEQNAREHGATPQANAFEMLAKSIRSLIQKEGV